jgi:hypothetical protein
VRPRPTHRAHGGETVSRSAIWQIVALKDGSPRRDPIVRDNPAQRDRGSLQALRGPTGRGPSVHAREITSSRAKIC